MASSIPEMVHLRQVSENVYESKHKPERMGNSAPIAYGGCTLAVAVSAAFKSLPATPPYTLYSAQGSYLSPASTDRPYFCSVRELRSTRTFATRIVEVGQRADGGKDRVCLILLADFHIPEPASLMDYSAPPLMRYSPPTGILDLPERRKQLIESGTFPKALVQVHETVFGLMSRFFGCYSCPEGVATNNLHGIAKTAVTPQESCSLTDKTSADWYRSRHKLENAAEQAAALSFLMDGAIAFVPLTHSHRWLDDAAACSSLDFSLRVFVPDLDMNKFHIKENRTIAGGNGRTFSEGRLWDEHGKMVASMTQQSILRPKQPKL